MTHDPPGSLASSPASAAAAAVPSATGGEFERYRDYLSLLARTQVARQWHDRLDVSGVVQQTFLEAHEQRHQFRGGGDDAATAAWLRRILAHNLADARKGLARAKRDAGRERSLEQELEQSSVRLGTFLAADQSSPSQAAQRTDRAFLLAEALESLPEAQREVVLLRHWEGHSLAEVAARLGRTPASVVGLLQRGLKALRERLADRRERGEV